MDLLDRLDTILDNRCTSLCGEHDYEPVSTVASSLNLHHSNQFLW